MNARTYNVAVATSASGTIHAARHVHALGFVLACNGRTMRGPSVEGYWPPEHSDSVLTGERQGRVCAACRKGIASGRITKEVT